LNSIHPRTKLDVGYRLSRSGLAIAYGQKNINYQGPIPNEVARDSDDRINVTFWSTFSSSIELRNTNGFEVCCIYFIPSVMFSFRYVVNKNKHVC